MSSENSHQLLQIFLYVASNKGLLWLVFKKIYERGRVIATRKVLVWLVAGMVVLGSLLWVFMRTGPMAVVEITVRTPEEMGILREAFGIGLVEARRSYKIGPTAPGRVRSIFVDVGDTVEAGTLLGEMDPVDIDAKIRAQEAGVTGARADVSAAEFALRELEARKQHASNQATRYQHLSQSSAVSAETYETKRQELSIGEASYHAGLSKLDASRQALIRAEEDLTVLVEQRANLRLIAQVSGLVVLRQAEPGTTIVAGQPVIEIIDPASLWVNTRFDQIASDGLRQGLPARVVLRSRPGEVLKANVSRIEPLADAVTEELLAKVAFENLPTPLPPVGELCEVTVSLPATCNAVMVLPAAALHGEAVRPWVWVLKDGSPEQAAVRVGARDLLGNTEILEGITPDAAVIIYSAKPLSASSHVRVVPAIRGGTR